MRSPPLQVVEPLTQRQHTTTVCGGGGLNKYQRRAADCLQVRRESRQHGVAFMAWVILSAYPHLHRASLVTGVRSVQKSTGAWEPHLDVGREEERYG